MAAENSSTSGSSIEKSNLDQDFLDLVDKAKIKAAVRKLDWTITPIMTMFYLLSFLDRANIGNARVAGLQKDLHMTDHQYSIAVTTTYVPYILSELPANLILRKIGPNIMMPTILTIWGIIVTLQGFVTNYQGLIACRFFLGLVEGPMFPGIVLYLSQFYTREELSLRIAYFFSSASLSGAFSGLLAAAIDNMEGIGGKAAWSWIFILEGLFSFLVGLISFFLVPATPRDSKFLTEEQKEIVVQRLERDRPFVSPLDKFSFRQVLASAASPHVILIFMMYFMGGANLYGLALFLPSIVNQLGYSPTRTQLLSVGPFAAGFFVTILGAYFSDRFKQRTLPLLACLAIAAAGYALYLGSHSKHTSYGSLFLMVSGIYGTTPIIAAWLSNNSEPYYRRATSIALGFVATNSGGILSTWRYPTKEGPKFRQTNIMNLTFTLVMALLTVINAAMLHSANKRKEREREKILAPYASDDEKDGGTRAWVELGDRHPDFRYVL